MKYGFIKVAAAIPSVRIADCKFNISRIEEQMRLAEEKGAKIIAFPEMSITAYTCGDLFGQQLLLEEAESALSELVKNTCMLEIATIIGMPVSIGNSVINAAVVIQGGSIAGIVPKTYLPNYKEFYEQRWFASSADILQDKIEFCGQEVPVGTNLLFQTKDTTFGIEICEDVWAAIPPSSYLSLQGAEVIINLSATNECIGKHNYLLSVLSQQSARCMAGYIYSSCGFGESTTDVVFAGNALIYENGTLLAQSKRFDFDEQLVMSEIDIDRLRAERRMNTTFAVSKSKLRDLPKAIRIPLHQSAEDKFEITRTFDMHPFVPKGAALDERCEEIFAIQTSGLAQRLVHTRTKNVVVGISGGLDSTLALLVCVHTFDKLGLSREGIIGITMPGFGTTDRTYNNAIQLMKSLGITIREISIKAACIQHFKDIDHNPEVHDITYENSQARERTQILMDIANQVGGLVIGTGDLSELALGWATYNGDHMSMYAVNTSIPKTLVKHLVKWVAEHDVDKKSRETLLDIVDTPISPELIPADENGNIKQKTEDLVGPYELHDFFLYYFLRFGFRPTKIFKLTTLAFKSVYTDDVIKKWLYIFFRRFFNQQFKRSCLPDGPKVGSISISPRGDWRMPSDASSAAWLEEIEKL